MLQRVLSIFHHPPRVKAGSLCFQSDTFCLQFASPSPPLRLGNYCWVLNYTDWLKITKFPCQVTIWSERFLGKHQGCAHRTASWRNMSVCIMGPHSAASTRGWISANCYYLCMRKRNWRIWLSPKPHRLMLLNDSRPLIHIPSEMAWTKN